jgi:hypothetical protein
MEKRERVGLKMIEYAGHLSILEQSHTVNFELNEFTLRNRFSQW